MKAFYKGHNLMKIPAVDVITLCRYGPQANIGNVDWMISVYWLFWCNTRYEEVLAIGRDFDCGVYKTKHVY